MIPYHSLSRFTVTKDHKGLAFSSNIIRRESRASRSSFNRARRAKSSLPSVQLYLEPKPVLSDNQSGIDQRLTP
jgi:hypothetical protein